MLRGWIWPLGLCLCLRCNVRFACGLSVRLLSPSVFREVHAAMVAAADRPPNYWTTWRTTRDREAKQVGGSKMWVSSSASNGNKTARPHIRAVLLPFDAGRSFMFVAHEAEKTFQVAYDRAKLNNAAATMLLSRLQERARPVDRLRTKTLVACIGLWKFEDTKTGTYTFSVCCRLSAWLSSHARPSSELCERTATM